MQPCAVCGGVSINQAGYCTHCGTFRGFPAAQPGYPGQPQAQPQPQPTSGGPGYPPQPAHPGGWAGQGGYPSAGGPAQPYPTSGAPGYPTSGAPGYPSSGAPGYPGAGGYPGYPVAAPPPQRGRSYLIPLIALGSTLAVLIVAITVVVAIQGAGDSGTGVVADPSSSASSDRPEDRTPSPTPAAGVDPCVVGSWQVDSHREDVALEEPFGKVTFTSTGPGALVDLRSDGQGTTDYGDGTTYEGVVSGITVTLTFVGQISYRFRAIEGTVSFSNVRADGTVTLSAPGVDSETQDLVGDFDPARYECGDDQMTQSTSLYTVRMSRL
ncbi:hypothetical protein O7632_02920 [Solwaraspora sp. WMMD406]|uniref:hypothetical protein n=1 Tax=Solwaraspora sp. WMMD406 TaxID=3016095 RepID=UPI002417EED6|nr:hypothetical protein [Solwaraspora sp. WMMD406]MDG4763067.1 hypothetical protein [Solwaraspora sp. WMMD406]